MTIQIARRLGAALGVRSGSKIKTIDESLRQYSREVPSGETVPMSGSIDTSQVVSGTFEDARIAESNVTQHQAALSIAASQITGGNSLGNYANDAAAAAGGVAVGKLYRNGSVLMTRVV